MMLFFVYIVFHVDPASGLPNKINVCVCVLKKKFRGNTPDPYYWTKGKPLPRPFPLALVNRSTCLKASAPAGFDQQFHTAG